jgi:hypothetical protein
MTFLALSYIALAFGGLAALCKMILRIGAMIGTCPDNGAAARAAAVTIATGFAAIGAGGVILIGALLPLNMGEPIVAFLAAAGLASLCLGLGFTHAIGTLRAVLLQRNLPAAA